MRYPIILTKDDNHTLLVTSPDFPELTTFGDDERDAIAHAADAFVSVIADRIANREPVPSPSKHVDKAAVLSATEALKVALYQAMTADGVSRAELARRLDSHLFQVDRLVDIRHASRLDQLENALRAMGREVTILVDKAA